MRLIIGGLWFSNFVLMQMPSIIVFGMGVGIPIGSTLCMLYNLGEEDTSHLFFTCEVSRSLWNRCGGWLGVQFVHHCSAKKHFMGFCAFQIGRSGTGVWVVLWLTIV